MRIFYVTEGVHIAGGQRVNLAHVLALRRLGYDAALLIVQPNEDEAAIRPVFPPGQEAPWRTGVSWLTADDIVVVGEMFGAGATAVDGSPARKLIHNQGPFYTFKAFVDLERMRRWGCEGFLTPSAFAAQMISRMGWDRPLFVVHPALNPVFAAAGGESGGAI